MMSYAEAKEKALSARSDYDCCAVRKDAYIFSCTKDEMNAGGPGPIVILKDGGRALNFTAYIYNHLTDEEIESFDFGSEAEKKYLEDK